MDSQNIFYIKNLYNNKISFSLLNILSCYSMEKKKEIYSNNININININNINNNFNEINLNINNIDADNEKDSDKEFEIKTNTNDINKKKYDIYENTITKQDLEKLKKTIRRTNSCQKVNRHNVIKESCKPVCYKRYNSASIEPTFIDNTSISYHDNSVNIKKYNKYVLLKDYNTSFETFKNSKYLYMILNTKKNFLGCSGQHYYITKNKKNELYFCKITKAGIDERIILNEIKINKILSKEKNLITFTDVYVEENAYFFSKSNNRYYLFSKYCENGDLFTYIIEYNINYFNMYKIMYDIINFVYTFHKNNISHRDIKPENIFLDKMYNLYLGDFTFSTKLIIDDQPFGSENYASPDMYAKCVYDCKKNDIYSLSVILYVILFEEFPGKRKKIMKNFKELKDKIRKYKKKNITNEFVDSFIKFFDNTYFKTEKKRWDIYDIITSDFYSYIQKKQEPLYLTYKFSK